MNSVQCLIDYWKSVFSNENPNEILEREYSVIPNDIMERFQTEFLPEPYYGYFHEDMSNDILALLLNPGEVSEDVLNKLADGESREEKVVSWNNQIRNRHLHWGKEEFIKWDKKLVEIASQVTDNPKLKKALLWRETRQRQASGFSSFNFFHTIEFFPYHSKSFKISSQELANWMFELKTTNLAVNAVLEIARERKVKHIVGLQNPWKDILVYRNIPLLQEVIVRKRGSAGSGYSFKFSKFQQTPKSLPIVIYSSGAGYINFPVNPIAVQIIRILLGIEEGPIPSEHEDYEISIQENELNSEINKESELNSETNQESELNSETNQESDSDSKID